MRASQSLILIAAAAAAAILVAFTILQPAGPSAPPEEAATASEPQTEERSPPSLDCAFRSFLHTGAGVYFYFDAAQSKGKPPRFFERTFVSADGSRKTYSGDQRPAWTYGFDGDRKQVITSPDAATRIVLYGLKLGAPGVMSIEAGIRSNVYRNLGGECRQTNLDGP